MDSECNLAASALPSTISFNLSRLVISVDAMALEHGTIRDAMQQHASTVTLWLVKKEQPTLLMKPPSIKPLGDRR